MTLSTQELLPLVGRRVNYHGRRLQVVEVLAEGPAIVLQEPAGSRIIQANQFGEAGRRVPETWTIPVLAPGGRDYHPLFKALELL